MVLALYTSPGCAEAQQTRAFRVGVIHQGGSYDQAIVGLQNGLRELGWKQGEQYLLHMRNAKGDLKAVGAAASSLEAEKVDLICAFSTSTTLSARDATKTVPIVFHVGTDPVKIGLVKSFRQPGGRLTGVYSQVTDLTAKRLQILKEMVPRLRRVMSFYNPDNPSALESVKVAREGAQQLDVTPVERPVRSVEELRVAMRALRPGEVDGLLHISDAMLTSQSELLVDIVKTKKLPLIMQDKESVVRGGLASYGISYYMGGRLTAKYIQRVLLGEKPADLPIEQVDRQQLVINLKTARLLGLQIPESLRQRADEIIQ
jgi:putative ABC transport system substrate-binding protein